MKLGVLKIIMTMMRGLKTAIILTIRKPKTKME